MPKVMNEETGVIFSVPKGTPPDQWHLFDPSRGGVEALPAPRVPAAPSLPAAPAPTSGPVSDPANGGGWYAGINRAFERARRPVTDVLWRGIAALGAQPTETPATQAPREASAREVAELVNPVPGSVPEAATMLATGWLGSAGRLPFRAPFTGGRLRQVAKVAGASTAAGVLAHSADAWVRERDLLLSAFQGTAQGLVGGVLSGLGLAMRSPNSDFLRASRAIEELRRTSLASPNVLAPLDPKNPRTLFAGDTLRRMQEAASANIQQVVDDLARSVTPGERVWLDTLGTPPAQATTAARRALRGTNVRWRRMHLGGQPVDTPGLTIADAQRVIAQLKSRPSTRQLGYEVEAEFVEELDRIAQQQGAGPALSEQYRAALAQYRHDKRYIDTVAWAQGEQAVAGGKVNPVDYPDIARATRELMPRPTLPLSVAHTALGVARPLTPWGAWHLLQATRGEPSAIRPERIMRPGLAARIGGGLLTGAGTWLGESLPAGSAAMLREEVPLGELGRAVVERERERAARPAPARSRR